MSGTGIDNVFSMFYTAAGFLGDRGDKKKKEREAAERDGKQDNEGNEMGHR